MSIGLNAERLRHRNPPESRYETTGCEFRRADYVSVPFVFPYHADPDDFYRFSYRGVAILCEAFDRVDSGFNRGPASTMHHLLVHFLALLFSFNTRSLYAVNLYVLRWLLFWVKYLDKYLAHHPQAYVIHAGAYFIGQKPPARTVGSEAAPR